MHADNELTPLESDYVFALPGEVYAAYLPDGGTTTLDLSEASGTFEVKWYDPRMGGELQDGSVTTVEGGGSVSLGIRVAGGEVIAYGITTAINEGAEVRFVGWQKEA